MNARKPIAVVAAALITAAGMFGIATYSNAAADAAHDAINATAVAVPVTVLPTIEVRPSAEQLRELHRTGGGSAHAPAGANSAGTRMPYYSFADNAAGA